MLDSLKPAQNIQVTITKIPRRQDSRQTIARLMRLDMDLKNGLRRAQRHRRKVTIVRTRGGRPWAMRMKRTLVAKVEQGATWTMPYFPQLRSDLASVAEFLEIKPA